MRDSTAQTTEEWVFIAKSIGELADSQVPAMRCMVMAGLVAESVSDWMVLAKAWAQGDDDELSRQCMAKAEAVAEVSDEVDDWTTVGDSWAEMGYHDKAVEIARERLEPREWPYLAQLEQSREELPAGTTALDWIEPGMTERAAHDVLGNISEQTESSYTDTAHALVSAENLTESTQDWILIAKAWIEKLQNSEEAKRCMKEAESAIDTPHDRVLLAKAWKDHFDDLQAAIRCLVRELGVLPGSGLTELDSWFDHGDSDRDEGYRAAHYSFTLSEPGEVTIDLFAQRDDGASTGLYLISGDTFTGNVIVEADGAVETEDYEDFEYRTLCRIRRSLNSGAYSIEARSDMPVDFTIDISLSSSA